MYVDNTMCNLFNLNQHWQKVLVEHNLSFITDISVGLFITHTKLLYANIWNAIMLLTQIRQIWPQLKPIGEDIINLNWCDYTFSVYSYYLFEKSCRHHMMPRPVSSWGDLTVVPATLPMSSALKHKKKFGLENSSWLFFIWFGSQRACQSTLLSGGWQRHCDRIIPQVL